MAANLNPMPAKYATTKAWNLYNLVKFTIGSKTSNTINVAVQLQDAHGQNIGQIAKFTFYLSDSADGHTLTATATTSVLAIGTNGVLFNVPVTGKNGNGITDASGRFDINVIQTAGGTNYYLVVELPDGSIQVSPVVAF